MRKDRSTKHWAVFRDKDEFLFKCKDVWMSECTVTIVPVYIQYINSVFISFVMENSKTLLELAPITNTFGIVLTLLSCSLSLRRHAHGTLGKHRMHMAHKSGNTLGISKLSLDWIIQDFRETCLLHSLTFRLETKMAWHQNTLAKEESRCVYNCDKCLSGSNKCWIVNSMWNI